ncbi:MAG: phospholipase D-like domain-containing protein [Gammaproteobacteria bacterium]
MATDTAQNWLGKRARGLTVRPVRALMLVLALLMVALAGCHSFKPLPAGLSYAGPEQPVSDIRFLADQTWVDDNGDRHVSQEIFDAAFALIDGAQSLIVADLFLYNDWQGPIPETTRALSDELTQKLIAKKQGSPEIQIVLITDPVNTLYGGLESAQFERLSAAGVIVVETDLNKLRDSNKFYSPFWRLFVKPFGNSTGGALPNPIGPGKVSLRTYLKLFNFKANHRKTVIADRNGELVAVVASANPHDGSSAHRNAGLEFNGPAVVDLLETENAVLRMSALPVVPTEPWRRNAMDAAPVATLRVVTEEKIRDAILDELNTVGEGDHVDLMMFYLSSSKVIAALRRAHRAGARVRIMLDPNKDAFGREKSGVPNRPAARGLHRDGVPIRWCETSGEQCHAKMLTIHRVDGTSTLLSGSANFTRRNLGDLNLETDVQVTAATNSNVMQDAQRYFDGAWLNLDGRQASVAYEVYQNDSLWLRFVYRFNEFTGFNSY